MPNNYPEPLRRKTTGNYTRGVVSKEYSLTCYRENHIYLCKTKWRAVVWTGPTFISVTKFMAQIWWSDCKRREQMHKPILLHSFWQKRPFLWPKIRTSNPHLNLPLAFRLKLTELAWTDGSAIFVLHIITHTLYCYNWTFHCFSFRTPYNNIHEKFCCSSKT